MERAAYAAPPPTGDPVGQAPAEGSEDGNRVRSAEPLCLLTQSYDLAYVTFGRPSGGQVEADIALWTPG